MKGRGGGGVAGRSGRDRRMKGRGGRVEGRTNRGQGHEQGNKIDRVGIRDTPDAGSRDTVLE